MAESITYVRDRFLEAEKPPSSDRSVFAWIHRNLFASVTDGAMTIVAILAIVWYLPAALNWLFVSAVWTGTDRMACLTTEQGGQLPAGWSGACWAYVNDRFVQFMFGSYPRDQLWRPLLVVVMFVGLLIPFLMPKAPRKGLNALLLLVVFPIVSFFLLLGGSFGLRHVETSLWGGLMVTLIISFVGIVVSLPAGILLALGRRSTMPILKTVCGRLHRVDPRRAADHRSLHGERAAAAVPRARQQYRQVPARADRRVDLRIRLYGGGYSRWSSSHSERAI
jgi:general L-amino acid transport system permease protein